MELVHPLAQQYAEKYTSADDELLREIEAFTSANHPHAHMISGHLQGQLLQMISRMIRPSRILEIGTFTGYSALSLAAGLQEQGMLHTIELREADAGTAKSYFERSAFSQQIRLHIGDARTIIGELRESWDLVFIDADKENYIHYFNLVFPHLKPKGFILADNVLFHGQVLEDEVKGKNAKAIQAFNDFLLERDDVNRVMLTVRDGLFLIQKK